MNLKHNLKRLYINSVDFFQSLLSILKVLTFSSFRSAKEIKKLRKKFQGNECYIFGNGPSLNKLLNNNIELIDGKPVFAVNFFCSTDNFHRIKPKFYFIIDSLFFNEISEDHNLGNFRRFRRALESVNWEMTVFVPNHFKNSNLVKSLNNKNIKWVWINITPVEGIKPLRHLLYNCDLGMPFPQTVINAVIFLAIRINFKKINLFGTEQSWLKGMYVDENNVVRTELEHFYPSKIDVNAPSLSNLLAVW